MSITSHDKSSLQISLKIDVKSISIHVAIYLIACIPLSKSNAIGMGLEYLKYNLP